MRINISSRHGHLSESSQEKISAKVAKLSRFSEHLKAIDVTVDLQRPELPSVELLVSAKQKHEFVATDQSENLLTSVENTVHKMEQQLKKYKEKLQDHRFSGTGQMAAEIQDEPLEETFEQDENQ